MNLSMIPAIGVITGIPLAHWIAVAAGLTATYAIVTCIYNLYFHPLSRVPGPKLASVSSLWYAYHDLSGKRPWRMAEALKKYGDVVRISPNELLFATPQAAIDIHTPHEKYHETFVKTSAEDVGTDGGITFETDPARHREVAKKLAPAFSIRNIKAKEATMHKHVDIFIEQMRAVGGGENGAEMKKWADWLSMDLSADMTYNRQMDQMKDMKNSLFLDCAINTDLFATLRSLFTSRFPLLTPLMYLFIPPSVIFSVPRALKLNSEVVSKRIDNRGKTEHLDYFEQLLPADAPLIHDKAQLEHLELVSAQLLVAGWDPVSNQLYSSLFFALQNPEAHKAAVYEIRDAFATYDDITIEAINKLPYLHAFLQETFRIHSSVTDGLPRTSPGAVVDGLYVPKGTTVQVSFFAASRDTRYFAAPSEFRPERWLPKDHPLFDVKFKDDNHKAMLPFSQGPRMCPGSVVAWATMKLFLAKVLWSFDVEMVPGQELSFDRDFSVRFMWNKPKLLVRFVPVIRK